MQNAPKRRGRQPDANSKSGKIRELLGTGMSASDIAKKLGCTPALVYNVKARLAGGGGSGAKRRGPGRPAKAAASNLTGLDGILDAVKNSEKDRSRMRAALEKIQAVIADALA
jgi:transposase